MDLVWYHDYAEASYFDTIRSCPNLREMGVPELLSAIAAGWMSKLIVEIWSSSDPIEESVGLTMAAYYTGGRHVCIVPNKSSKEGYLKILQEMGTGSPELVVAEEAETVVRQYEKIDFLVVDCTNDNLHRVLRAAKIRPEGAVLVCKNLRLRNFIGQFELMVQQETGMHVERSISQACGNYFDIVHVRSMTHTGPSPPPPPQPPSQLPQSLQPTSSNSRPRRVWFKIQDLRLKIFEV